MDDEQQQQPIIRSTPYQSPMHLYGSSMLQLTNPKSTLYNIELMYRGLKEDGQGNMLKVGEPLMNEAGINSICGTTEAIVNPITILGSSKDSEIRGTLMYLNDTLAEDLMMNKKKYGMGKRDPRSTIHFTAVALAQFTMKRSENNGERGFWRGSLQEIKTTVDTQSKGGGILSKLWKK